MGTARKKTIQSQRVGKIPSGVDVDRPLAVEGCGETREGLAIVAADRSVRAEEVAERGAPGKSSAERDGEGSRDELERWVRCYDSAKHET